MTSQEAELEIAAVQVQGQAAKLKHAYDWLRVYRAFLHEAPDWTIVPTDGELDVDAVRERVRREIRFTVIDDNDAVLRALRLWSFLDSYRFNDESYDLLCVAFRYLLGDLLEADMEKKGTFRDLLSRLICRRSPSTHHAA